MIIADTHTHSHHSIDSKCPPDKSCSDAYERGFSYIAISDHCDVNRDGELDVYGMTSASVADARRLREEYRGKMQVGVSIEIGNPHMNLPLAEKCAKLDGIDCIIGAVHRIELDGEMLAATKIEFEKLEREMVNRIIDRYFENILELLDVMRPDILAHPGYMLRYAIGYHGVEVDLPAHLEMLDRVLERVIDEGIVLEFNTSIVGDRIADYDRFIFARYYELGGRLVSLGSDAHKSERIGNGFELAADALKQLGFTRGCCFVDRELHTYEL